MAGKSERQFQGFSRRTFTFLRDLGRNNDKAWFEAHRGEYERYVLAPLRDLVNDLADFMLGIDLSFEAAPDLMARFRRQIDENPESFLKAIAWFAKQDVFTLEGTQYKRPLGQDKPEPIRTWYGFKSFYLTCDGKIDNTILSPKLVDQLMKHFGMAAPLYHYVHRIAAQVVKTRV